MDAIVDVDDDVPAVDARSGAVDAPASARHKWSFSTKPKQVEDSKTKEYVKVYPFLADSNVQDFLFAKLLIIEAPYAAAKGKQTDAWNNFHQKLVNTSDIHGGKPFALIKLNTAKTRFNEYKALAQDWLDKARAKGGTDDDDLDYGFLDREELNAAISDLSSSMEAMKEIRLIKNTRKMKQDEHKISLKMKKEEEKTKRKRAAIDLAAIDLKAKQLEFEQKKWEAEQKWKKSKNTEDDE
jgi:hypothetical protein